MSRWRRRPALLLAVGAVVLAGLVSAPHLWKWYRAARAHAAGELAVYEPRELVRGANEPLAPRVAPDLELLDPAGLQAAAGYAAAHGSRALIVSRHDHIVFEGYWQGTSFDTLADAQSFTPLLAALAAGTALTHHFIGWPDEPVGAFIAEWSHDPRGAITVRNLLQSSSGLAPAAQSRAPPDLLAAVLGMPLARSPGATRVEQPADPQLLALVVERATGERYASYLSQALWRRVGAADAWLWLDRAGGSAHAGCCMLARQGDWIRIGQLLARDGNYRGDEVVRPGYVALMRQPGKADPAWGAYVRLATGTPAGQEAYATRDLFVVQGAGGNRLWIVPSLQLAILCTGAAGGRDPAWKDSQIPNLIIRAARDFRAPAAPPGDASSLVPGH
jgi:CubicO group peptidase (beta-lactamase class C family)